MANRFRPAVVAAALLASLTASTSTEAAEILVAPYLQQVGTTTAFVMLETDDAVIVTVEYGSTSELASEAVPSVDVGGGSVVYTAELVGLLPATRYSYRATVDGVPGTTHTFFTSPEAADADTTRFVAMSDMQVDSSNRGKFGEIVNNGVIPWVSERYGLPLDEALAGTLLPGDLVDDGLNHDEWIDDFFGGGAALFASAAPYPAVGNHERNSPRYFRYFHLPDNGDEAGLREHWWAHDVANVRLIGLDSNELFAILPQQTEWLAASLEEACTNTNIDFVLLQLHHPHQSELWMVGESRFSQNVSDSLAVFSTECGKPSAMLFGHTHGYSRGASRDHPHFMVNVATGGGNIDYWGESLHVDYEDMEVSTADYGFVIIEATGGDAPSLALTRVGMGDEADPTPPTVRDEVQWRADNVPPAPPQPISGYGRGIASECSTFSLQPASDPDGDAIAAIHWQISADCNNFETPVVEKYITARNEFGGADIGPGALVTSAEFAQLEPSTEYCWRARARDAALAWSDWSAPAWFLTNAATLSENLVTNPGAEDELDTWESTNSESTRSEDCLSARTQSGERMFALGGSCRTANEGSITQRIPLTDFAEQSDAGTLDFVTTSIVQTAFAFTSVATSVSFENAEGLVLGEPFQNTTQSFRWETTSVGGRVPTGARTAVVSFSAAGSREPLFAYVDDVSFRVGTAPNCAASGDLEVPDGGGDDVGLDAGSDSGDASSADAGSDVNVQDEVTGESDPDAETGGAGGCSSAGSPRSFALASFGLLFALGTVRLRRRAV
jgi:hypothetical protein